MIGAGGVAQVEHIPNLLKLKRQFEIVGVYDPSAKVRAFIGEEFGVKAVRRSRPAARLSRSTPW